MFLLILPDLLNEYLRLLITYLSSYYFIFILLTFSLFFLNLKVKVIDM